MTIDENSTLVEVLQDVGDAVREKGVSGEWKGYQLPSAVRSIRSDPVYDSRVTIQVNGVSNGSFTVNQTSDSTINLQTLTMEQVSAAVAASYATKGEVGAVTENVSSLSSSVSALASTVDLKRDFFDLVYPNFNDDINDGFGMRFAYSFEGGMGSILPFNGTEYADGSICATWGWHGQILVAMPNQSTIWLFDKYDNLKHTISLNEFKKTTQWLDYVSPAQDDMVIDALGVPRIVYLYLQTALDGRDKNTKIVLENQLSAYATTSALSVVTASVSTLTSSVSALGSSVGEMASTVSALASSIEGKRDYDDLTYGGTYDPTDAEGYYGITSWNIAGYKYNGQTLPAFNTATRGKNNPTYGTFWNNAGQVIYTSDFSTFNLDGFGNAEPVPFTLSLDKTTYEVSFMGTEQQDIILTANCVNQDRLALNSQLAPITASVSAIDASVSALGSDISAVGASVSALGSSVNGLTSSVEALGSSVSDLGSQVSAMASSLSAKRDYLDLTYSTTVPSETIDNSKLVWDDQDPLYNAKLTFTVNDSVAGDENLSWDSNQTCWVDNQIGNFMVYYIQDWSGDSPDGSTDGKFVLIDGSDVCLQFNLQDGVNVQTFNYTSGNYGSTGTLTMTFTGEPAHQVNDTIALNGEVTSAISSITTTLSSYATQAYVDASIQDAIGAMLSSQL